MIIEVRPVENNAKSTQYNTKYSKGYLHIYNYCLITGLGTQVYVWASSWLKFTN